MNNAANTGVVPAATALNAAASAPTTYAQQIKTTGVAGTWGNGEVNVGIRGAFGDLAFGANNNAGLNYIQAVAAPTQGTSFAGGYGTVLGADPTMTIVRWANSFRYISPTVNGFTGSYIYAFKQNSASVPVSANTGVAVTTTSLGVGLNNQVGAQEIGLKYANGPLTLGAVANKTSIDSFCSGPSTAGLLGYSTGAAGSGSLTNNPCYSATTLAGTAAIMNGQDNKQTSFAASYALPSGLLFSGAMQKTQLGQVQGLTLGSQSDRTANFYNVQYTMGMSTFFANIGTVKENATNSTKVGLTGKWVGAGYNYALSKNTSLVARWESFRDDTNVLGLTATTAYTSTQGQSTTDNTRIRSQIGLNMNF